MRGAARGGPGRRGAALLAVVGLLVTGAGCARQSPRAIRTGSPAAPVTASAGSGGTQTVTVRGDDAFKFTPSTIVARPGRIRIVLHNAGRTPHNLTLPGLGTGTTDADAGQDRTVTLTVAKPGTYRFVCTYHRTLGMVGSLIVR